MQCPRPTCSLEASPPLPPPAPPGRRSPLPPTDRSGGASPPSAPGLISFFHFQKSWPKTAASHGAGRRPHPTRARAKRTRGAPARPSSTPRPPQPAGRRPARGYPRPPGSPRRCTHLRPSPAGAHLPLGASRREGARRGSRRQCVPSREESLCHAEGAARGKAWATGGGRGAGCEAGPRVRPPCERCVRPAREPAAAALPLAAPKARRAPPAAPTRPRRRRASAAYTSSSSELTGNRRRAASSGEPPARPTPTARSHAAPPRRCPHGAPTTPRAPTASAPRPAIRARPAPPPRPAPAAPPRLCPQGAPTTSRAPTAPAPRPAIRPRPAPTVLPANLAHSAPPRSARCPRAPEQQTLAAPPHRAPWLPRPTSTPGNRGHKIRRACRGRGPPPPPTPRVPSEGAEEGRLRDPPASRCCRWACPWALELFAGHLVPREPVSATVRLPRPRPRTAGAQKMWENLGNQLQAAQGGG